MGDKDDYICSYVVSGGKPDGCLQWQGQIGEQGRVLLDYWGCFFGVHGVGLVAGVVHVPVFHSDIGRPVHSDPAA